MPFGSKNTPVFYFAMIQFLRECWILLFQGTKDTIVMTNTSSHILCDNRIIIDDILLFSNHVSSILHYFSCVARIFTKYRLSFKWNKCDFFQPRVKYVDNDLTAHNNCPTASKFDSLQNWPSHPIESCVYLSSVCVASIIDIILGLKPTLNHYENYSSNFIIIMIFLSWNRHNLPFNYSMTVKLILLLPLFNFVATSLDLPSSI